MTILKVVAKWFLVLWPVTEIALFVVIGGRIGLLATLGVILGTGMLGVWIFRRLAARTGPVSGLDAADHVLRAVSAILLILPGFLTDAMGLVLLIPFLRHGLIAMGAARLAMRFGPLRQAASRGGYTASADIIDADYVDLTPAKSRDQSPWLGK